MALTVKLFVHGVPAGKKQWGKFCEEDQRYLDQFYQGSKNIQEYMKVECRSIAGSPSVFYTFIIGKNINACDGRQGSYFALTLKMNSYYRDIQNIYAILKAAYHKYCMGLLLADRQNFVQFAIPDFKDKNEELLALEKSISDYIFKFSHDSDIKPLVQCVQLIFFAFGTIALFAFKMAFKVIQGLLGIGFYFVDLSITPCLNRLQLLGMELLPLLFSERSIEL